MNLGACGGRWLGGKTALVLDCISILVKWKKKKIDIYHNFITGGSIKSSRLNDLKAIVLRFRSADSLQDVLEMLFVLHSRN